MIIVLIVGASCSGKSCLADKLQQSLLESNYRAQVINMDNYYLPAPVWMDKDVYQATTNFDTPDAMNLDWLLSNIDGLNHGISVDKPVYDFGKQNYSMGKISACDVLIVEGLYAKILEKMLPENATVITVSVTTSSYQQLIERRAVRDMAERNYISVEQVKKREQTKVGVGFFKYVTPTLAGSDVQVINDLQVCGRPHPLYVGVLEIKNLIEEKLRPSLSAASAAR